LEAMLQQKKPVLSLTKDIEVLGNWHQPVVNVYGKSKSFHGQKDSYIQATISPNIGKNHLTLCMTFNEEKDIKQ